MRRNGRPADLSGFDPKHVLYHRCEKKNVFENRLLPASIRCDNTSCNWSKYSEPQDVVFDYPGQGIVRWLVEEIPTGIQQKEKHGRKETTHIFDFIPTHVPEEKNYSHSEIWTYKNKERRMGGPSDLVKKQVRQILSDRGVIIRQPVL